MKKLSWKPIRRGRVFCAPACGHNCTWEEHQTAQRKGRELAAKLGNGWKHDVWENLGWHYQATSPCGQLKVLEYSNRATCYFKTKSLFIGVQSARTARAAVKRCIDEGLRLKKHIDEALASIRE